TPELPERRFELADLVGRAVEEVARVGEEAAGGPVAPVDHAAVGEAMHTEHAADRRERDLDVRFARSLGAMVPGELAVADAVAVAMAEIDPVSLGRGDATAAPPDRVGVLEHHDPPALAREDPARPQPPPPP